MTARDKPPGDYKHLDRLLDVIAAEQQELALRLRRAVANTIVGQMLPAGVVKGGPAMKLRLGNRETRFTPDLDFARADTLQNFIDDFQQRLRTGWGGFTGRLVTGTPPRPRNVPTEYVVQPFEVKLAYLPSRRRRAGRWQHLQVTLWRGSAVHHDVRSCRGADA